MASPTRILIVGAGIAGVSAAFGARAVDPTASIRLFAGEPGLPYDRTSLSKRMLAEGADPDGMLLRPAPDYAAERVDLVTTAVASIEAGERRLVTADGDSHPYDALVLATGAAPRPFPPGVPAELAGRVHYLRDQGDADRLRTALADSRRLVVIGGGLIGLEVAAAARLRNLAVTVVEAAPRLLSRCCDAGTAERIAALHRDQGVTLCTGTGVGALETALDGTARVRLDDGTTLAADQVVIGIGVRPRTELAEAAGLTVADGIRVDAVGRTDQPGIYAAGDVAALPLPGLAEPVRLETWRHAQDHGQAVGRNAAGESLAYDKAPAFWSDQYQHRIQGVGLIDARTTRAVRRDASGGGHATFLLDSDDHLTAVVGLDSAKEINAARRLIGTGIRVSAEALTDRDQPIARLVKALLKG